MRRRSRAARELALAPVSYCPSCRRQTKTVGDGACAECWQAKDIGGRPGIPVREPRTEPLGLFDTGWPDWITGGRAAGLALALVAVVVGILLGVR